MVQNLDLDLIKQQKRWLHELAEQCKDSDRSAANAPPEQQAAFSLTEATGTQIYHSFTDQELLHFLQETADRIGHSPAQWEVFWVYRVYIRQRFKKWPHALELAGLSKSAGKGGKSMERIREEQRSYEALLQQVRDKAVALGRIPHPKDLPEVCLALKKQFKTWGELLAAAGITPVQTVGKIEDLEPDYQTMLIRLHDQALQLGRVPLRTEVEDALRVPLVRRCGSWRNTLFQIGLEPVVHIRPFSSAALYRTAETEGSRHKGLLADCYYQVLNLSTDALAALEQVRTLAGRLGRPPKRGEAPPELRRMLQNTCGSWSNALFQLGIVKE